MKTSNNVTKTYKVKSSAIRWAKKNIGDDWAKTNFGNKSRWFSWYVGGLNFQIEHHLFPNICHVHYRNISPIVRSTATEFGLPYKSAGTFLNALYSHLRLLRQLGVKPV